MSTCIVVADTTRARIFMTQSSNDTLNEIEGLVHPESRLHANQLGSDEPGISYDRSGSSHGLGQETDLKKQEAIRFAREVTDKITEVHRRNHYNKLYIIAAPAFLGLLRQTIPDTTKQLIAGEVNKNLIQLPPDDIRANLPRYL